MHKRLATALSVVQMRMAETGKPATPPHPARAHIHETSAGERVADLVVAGMGSWRFIIIQTVVVVLWITANMIGWRLHWDVYPFILLNLVFSTQAAYASPLILMAANRTAAKDRKRDDTEAQEVDDLKHMNQQQLDILRSQDDILHGQDAILARLEALMGEHPTAPTAAPDTASKPVQRSHRKKVGAQ